jgi:hypothetical protein
MTGGFQASEVEAVRGRLIERVHDQIKEAATTMTDMRATGRLLDVIAERSDDPRIDEAVSELRRRGDTIVRRRDLHAVLPLVDERGPVDPEAWRRLDGAQ